MSFFYDLNKKLDSIRATPEVTHQQLNERNMSRAAKGWAKYGDGMTELSRLGREGASEKKMDAARKKYDQYDNTEVDEGLGDMARAAGGAIVDRLTGKPTKAQLAARAARQADNVHGAEGKARRTDYLDQVDSRDKALGYDESVDAVKKIGKRVASGINRLVGHGSDEDMRNDLKRKAGVPTAAPKQTPMDPKDEYDYFTGRDKVRGGEQQVKEKLSPAKQKSFAALAPPEHKITFADKIAGAKKEVDEMLGDVAAEAMRSALGGGKGRNAEMDEDQPTHFEVHYKDNQKGRTAKTKVKGSDSKQAKAAWNDWNSSNTPGRFTFVAVKPVATEMDEERSKGTAFDMSTPRADKPKIGSVERGAKHDIKHTATGRMVTRRTDDQGNSVGADDDSDTQAGPRGRGRPKGTKGAIGAKGPSGKSKLMTREGSDQGQAQQIVDDLAELRAIAKQAQRGGEFPQGFASQLEVALYAAMTLIKNQQSGDAQVREEELDEKAVSKQQQKFMGMAHAMQKGEKVKGASKELKKVASTMKPKDTEDFAKTKHKGLPDKAKSKKKEKDVEESTTAGSVATSTATKGGGGMVGKGIYDSMNRELENMIAESMSINMSNSTEGGKSLTITATDEDALKLGMLLKSAGLGGGDAHGGDMHSHGEEACDTCGMQDCGCGDVQEAVDENSPDWPTNTETSPDALQYAGGLNKPKTDVAGDGQTTVPNSAVHTQDEDALRRMMEMAGINNSQLSEGMMDKLKSMLVPKLMKMLGADAEKIASAVKQATGGDLTSSKENAMKVVQALGIDKAATQGQSPQMAEGIAGNWQGKLIQALYTLGLLGSAGAAASMWGTMAGSHMAIIGTLLLMFAGTFFDTAPGQVGAMGNFGNKGTSMQKGLDDFGNPVRNMNVDEDDDLSRMMEIAGVKKKPMDEQKTEEGNRLTGGLEDDDVKIGDKIPGTNVIKKKDIDESIFALTNQWQAYKG